MADGALPPGGTLGILGGGQLGRMLAIAAARLGLRSHIFEPAEDPPAGDVAAAVTQADYGDRGALDAFAAAVDVVTLEFENVPVAALRHLAETVVVRPGAAALDVAQNRVREKDFLNSIGVPTAPYRPVVRRDQLADALAELGGPTILKTARFGYDGKGQVRIGSSPDADEADRAFAAMNGADAVLEGQVPFARELSVIVARGPTGEVRCYDPGVNVHRDGILHTTEVSGAVEPAIAAEATGLAGRIVEALDYVGVMGVEIFDLGDAAGKPRLLVNEIAPRVHNSGHWTIEACLVDQFQNHVRAVCGWPLGPVSRHSDAVMTNLIGHDVDAWPDLSVQPLGLHLYRKSETRAGRKMGHMTRLIPR